MVSATELLSLIRFYAPLGAIGIFRWSVWGLKRMLGTRYKPIPSNEQYTASVSVVVPVYREEPDIFRMHLDSIVKNSPKEIILVVDCRDEACLAIANEMSGKFPIIQVVVTNTPGKRPALRTGFQASTGDIIAFVDSDTIWPDNTIPALLAPFKDPLVGGVGCPQKVFNDDTLARKLFSIQLESRYNQEFRFLGAVGDAFTCLSGRTALYRRAVVDSVIDAMVHEKFAGFQCVGGDDKCLTRLMQERGWKSKFQTTAFVYTSGARNMSTLVKQETRWLRNTWRSDIQSIQSSWIWRREKPLAFHMIDRFLDPLFAVLSPSYFLVALYVENFLGAAILVAWWIVSRGIKVAPALRRHPRYIWLLPFYIAFEQFMNLVKIYAFFSMNTQGWMTRGANSKSDASRLQILFKIYSPFVAVLLVVTTAISIVAFYVSAAH